jgi:tetratricopeptide (TPR) repeat protein
VAEDATGSQFHKDQRERAMRTAVNTGRLSLFCGLQIRIAVLFFTTVWFPQRCLAQRFLRFSTSDLELYTSAEEADALATVRILEGARTFFSRTSPSCVLPHDRLRIMAFSSKEEYAPFRLNENAFGHYLHSPQFDYIVLQDLRPEHRRIAVHEYTHFVLRRAGLNLPVWLNEGLADLYSSFGSGEDTFSLGDRLPERLVVLQKRPLMRIADVFSVTRDSRELRDPEKMSIFYAQSWALSHMLALGSAYSWGFSDFLMRVGAGTSTVEALHLVYGKKVEQLEPELQVYLPQIGHNAVRAQPRFKTPSFDVEISPMSERDIGLVQADLLAAYPRTWAIAESRLLEILKLDPQNARAEQILGDLMWQANRIEQARLHWAHAVELGCKDPDTLYRYAQLEKRSGSSDEKVIYLLQQALDARPKFDEALFNLGVLEFNSKNYIAASAALTQIQNVSKDRSFTVYLMLAYCSLKSANLTEARSYGELASQFSTTTSERSQVDEFLQSVNALGPVRAEDSGASSTLAIQ